ncbi:MAG TPA: IclR family transcriptional regulator [Propionibacteriaceae bacterium]|nr:IclR family transcriptional regulator [Propionibacteriaceae bacterium]
MTHDIPGGTSATALGDRRDMVGKALHLLTVVGGATQGLTLSELARETGYPLSTTHRLIATLMRERFVDLDPTTRRYHVGLMVFALARKVAASRGFEDVALPVLRRLAVETRESTLMSVLDTDRQLYVAHVQGPLQLNVIGEPGTLGPLHCTSMGKVLIAFAPRAVRERLVESVELTPMAPNTVVDREAFAQDIADVRARGYALSDQEHEEGVRAIGVPVMGVDGTAMAAVSVAAPSVRRSIADLIDMLPHITQAARELAARLPAR